MYVCKYNNTSMITVYFFSNLATWEAEKMSEIVRYLIFSWPLLILTYTDWHNMNLKLPLTCLRHQHTISVCNYFCTELAIIIFVQKSYFCNFKWWHYQFCLLLWTEKILFVVSRNWVKVWSRPIEVFFIYCP